MILASTGAGYYILKNASDLGESLFQSSGQAFNFRFYIAFCGYLGIWILRVYSFYTYSINILWNTSFLNIECLILREVTKTLKDALVIDITKLHPGRMMKVWR
jgi:hypothetical protein